MRVFNTSFDPNMAFVHLISDCNTKFNKGCFLIIHKDKRTEASRILLSNIPAMWDKEKTPCFLYLRHSDENGNKIIEEFFETEEDFHNSEGEFHICPKCKNIMIKILEDR